jgi:hypothetical protein
MRRLRKFLSVIRISTRVILRALMSKEVGDLTVDKALPIFEAILNNKDPLLRYDEEMVELMWDALGCCAQGRALFVTDTGHVGVSKGDVVAEPWQRGQQPHLPEAPGLKERDLLVGLFGIMYPVILRKAEGDTYTMVNVAHVAEHTLGHSCDCETTAEGGSEENKAKCGHRVFKIM